MVTEGKGEKGRFAEASRIKKETKFDRMWEKFIKTEKEYVSHEKMKVSFDLQVLNY
jgi:hypothetical protein